MDDQLRLVRFGAFEVDFRSGELRKYDLRVRLQDQPFKILTLLLERAGEVVTREELHQKLWPADTFVDFDVGLNSAIKRLRDALCDSTESPRYIETLPRKGYRFIAEVEHVPAAPSKEMPVSIEPAEAPPVAEPLATLTRRRVDGRIWMVLFAATLVLVVAFNAGGLLSVFRTIRGIRTVQSVAVLPLENLSGDATQDYFVDGMTEALINDLGKVGELRVISRTSVMPYKGTKKSLQQIASELHVDALVEGTVSRSGNHVRITANLIQASPERHLWADSFERDLRDVLTLQDDVSRAIANGSR